MPEPKPGSFSFEAGDLQHALKNYSDAARLEPDNLQAATGAGEAAFQLGQYSKANRYLRTAVAIDSASQPTRRLLSLTDMVLAQDPLLPHLSPADRQSRLRWGVDQSLERLNGCFTQNQGTTEMQSLKTEALALQAKLGPKSRLSDQDVVRTGVELVTRIEKATANCGEPSPGDQALLLIGHEHKGEQP